MPLLLWLTTLERADVAGFHLINGSLRNTFFDSLMPFITDKWNAALPLLLLFLYVLLFRPKRDRILVISAIGVVLVADATTQILKSLFHRTRPCYVLENAFCYGPYKFHYLSTLLNTILSLTFHYGNKLLDAILPHADHLLHSSRTGAQVNGATHQGGFSFPSNHASNVFALAAFFSYSYRQLTLPCFVGASLVGYSRIYLGAHYPTDVLAGAVWGSFIGLSSAVVANRLMGVGKAHESVHTQPP